MRHVGVLGMLLCAGVLEAQGASGREPVRLAAPDAVFPEPFSLVRSLRELSDGRVMVVDWLEERVAVVDFGSGTRADIGRIGAGPREYRLPAGLVALPADTTLLLDWGNTRLSVISPQHEIVGTIPPPPGLPAATAVRGSDRRGGLYLSVPPWSRAAPRLEDDSVAVVRWDPATGSVERVAVIKGTTRPDRSEPRMTPGLPLIPFAPQDAWLAHPDGGVILVRSRPYRLERIALDGAVVRGADYAYRALRVSARDREAFVRRFNAQAPLSGRGPDGGLGHTPGSFSTPERIAEIVNTNEFAAVHPPFVAAGVWMSPEGEVWVERSRHAGATQVFDRFDDLGRRRGSVELPAGRRLVGLGRSAAYAVVADDMDLETLERYRR